MADSLPGLGIVAAVLGVVITMGALGGPPEEIGNKVAAALVGTFLGILLCYGLVGPIAANMTKAAEEEHAFLYVMRVLMVPSSKAALRSWRWKWRGAPFPDTCGHRSRNWSRLAVSGGAAAAAAAAARASGRIATESHGQNTRPIIILKKKGGHGGHHGGAWKVAYADFVTAMMALFIVLWLLNSSKQVQEAVGGYFKDPTGTSKKVGSNMVGAGENFVLTRDNMPKLKEQLQRAIEADGGFRKAEEPHRDDGHLRGSAHRALGIGQRNILRQRQRQA